jgi:hypothetical protein
MGIVIGAEPLAPGFVGIGMLMPFIEEIAAGAGLCRAWLAAAFFVESLLFALFFFAGTFLFAACFAGIAMPGMFICSAAAGADTIAADEQRSAQRIFTTTIS